jgi:hypothetical protein
MSRKHYVILAESIKQIANMEARLSAAIAVARACSSDNMRFDNARFFEACGV